jgi:hypothetical protein
MKNRTLDINIDETAVRFLFNKFSTYAAEKGVAIPDYLMPHEWDKQNSQSYEVFRDYMFEHLKTIPEGVTELYIHPSLECDELKGTSSVWFRRVWEHKLFADPATRRYIESLGIELINYRDLAQMKKYSSPPPPFGAADLLRHRQYRAVVTALYRWILAGICVAERRLVCYAVTE